MNSEEPKRKQRDESPSPFQISASNPVLEIELKDGDNPPPIEVQSDNLLRDMLFPLDSTIFMKDFFRQKAVHISTKGKYTDRIQSLIEEQMYNLDMESILNETSSENIFVWLHSQNENTTTNMIDSKSKSKKNNPLNNNKISTLRSIEISNPSTALSLHHVGHATYCRAPPELEQYLVSSLLRNTSFGCGQYDPSGSSTSTLGRGEVEVFAGTKYHYTNWHFDFQENFTIQLSGIKRWRLRQGHVKFPMRGCTPHYYYSWNNEENIKMNEFMVESQLKSHRLSNSSFEFGQQNIESNAYGEEVEILMYPGDILYFPAGIWHCVETVEMGISINVSLMATTYAHVVCQALQHLLLKQDPWRETIVNRVNNDDDNEVQEVLKKTRGLLHQLPDIIKEFAQNGGEQALFPPVLRYPANFISTEEEESKSIEEEEEESNHGKDNKSSTDMEQDSDCEASGSQVEIPNELDESKDFNVIDVGEFQAPNGWSWYKNNELDFKEIVSQARLVKNPLATLTKLKDISSFYCNIGKTPHDEAHHEDNESEAKKYVLNLSFGGNEMQESSVRTVMSECSESHYLEKCADCEKNDVDPASLFDLVSNDDVGTETSVPPLCLFYYGYFYWVQK